MLYKLFAYHLIRTEYLELIVLYSAIFLLFYYILKNLKNNIRALTYIAFGFRALFILAIPNLSQDFYRFIWDGRMILEGFNPYLFTVESFISQGEFPVAQAQELHAGMGNLNANHFTNYPPINQLCFAIAAFFSGKSILGSVVVLRLLIIAADFGTLHFGKKLLEKLDIPLYHIFWYILNPFIIIELTGNIHFEGVMIFFLIWGLYLLYIEKWPWAGVVFALSVSVKLIPLIFLPLFYQWFMQPHIIENKMQLSYQKDNNTKWHYLRNHSIFSMARLIGFYAIIIITTLMLFLPFYTSMFISNYTKTVALWFQNFEFNASLYYIAREIGYTFRGYNEIAIIGKITPILVIVFILIISFFRNNKTPIKLISAMLLILSFYYFTATTVHPWYIATLLILSIFTKYIFPLVWSFVIILSYLSYLNIDNANKSENLWIIAIEYSIVFIAFVYDIVKNKTIEKYTFEI